jgi:outer membrane protein
VEFVEPTSLLQAAVRPKGDPSTAGQMALQLRPELVQSRYQIESAERQAHARYQTLFPEIDLEAAYMHLDGNPFAPKNSAFVGLKAQWTVWEWGTTFYAARALAAQAEAAKLDMETQKRQILVDVASSHAQLDAAASAVVLAEQTITSAEEAYRVTDAQLKAGAATVTDLLDSQRALGSARLDLARARYEEAIARVSLDRAVGSR